MYIGYYILFIIIIFLIIKFYIYKKYGFWYYQPVFHYYDLYYWLFSTGIINKNLPIVNKFCNFYNIKSINYHDIDNKTINEIIDFIQKFYYNKNACKYLPTKTKFSSYFESNNKKSIISLYKKDGLQAVMTSRNVNLTMNYKTISVYYVDNLCVHSMYRKQGIAPEIIQTHEYNQAYINKSAQISLFKREGELTGIVPLTTYLTKQYKIDDNIICNKNLNIIRINDNNIQLLITFIFQNKEKYNCIILPDISCLINLIKKETYYVYGYLNNDKLLSCYFFKDSEMVYYQDNTEKKALDFFASINGMDKNIFINSLNNILVKFIKDYEYLTIEYIGDNLEFIDYFNNSKIGIISPTAYFLYNYVAKPIIPSKCLIII